MGFGVWGLGFGIWNLGFGVWSLGLDIEVLWFSVYRARVRWDPGFEVQDILNLGKWGLGRRIRVVFLLTPP